MKFFEQLNSDEEHRNRLRKGTAMNTEKTTPRPWRFDKKHRDVVDVDDWPILRSREAAEQRANAKLIVTAVNAHDKLIKLAELVAKDYEDSADWKDMRGELANLAEEALALAKGGE